MHETKSEIQDKNCSMSQLYSRAQDVSEEVVCS